MTASQTIQSKWTPSSRPVFNHPAPFKVRNHPEWPVCDCSYVVDANGSEICSIYTDHSAGVAQLIADAMTAFHASIKEPPLLVVPDWDIDAAEEHAAQVA